MLRPMTIFFVGALVGAATAGLVGVAAWVAPTYLGVAVGLLWGLPAAIMALADAWRGLRVAPVDLAAPAAVDASEEPTSAPAPDHTVYFSSAAAAGHTAPGSIFGGYMRPGGLSQPPQPPQPPQPESVGLRANGHAPAQPAAQPAAQPGRNRSTLADLMLASLGDDYDPTARPVRAPWDYVEMPIELAASEVDEPEARAAPMLPRRRPLAADYPVIWAALSGRSLSAASRALWGSKDGKTWSWLEKVVSYYADYAAMPIWVYELLGTVEPPAAAISRLGLEPLGAALVEAELARCQVVACGECGQWFEDLDDGAVTCAACREG